MLTPRYEEEEADAHMGLEPSRCLLHTLHASGRAGEGRVQSGEVLAWDEDKARHHVLYDDGEDEWLDLGAERLVWHKPGSRPAVAAGLPEGALPSGLITGRQRRLLCIVTHIYMCQDFERFSARR